jgi:tetratricopeptide (TPR) repeat protein
VVGLLGWVLGAELAAADESDLSALFARGEYQAVVDSLPPPATDDGRAYHVRSLRMLGEYEEALTTAETYLEQAPTAGLTAAAAGEILLFMGRSADAIALLEPVVEGVETPEPAARYVRAQAFADQGRTSRAQLEFSDFVRLYNSGQGRDAATLTLVARACRELGLVQDANTAFREAIEADPESVDARLHWALLFQDKYRPDEALTLVDEILERNPGHPEALVLKARLLVDTRYDIEGAEALISQALVINSSMVEARELRAELLIDDRRVPEAMETLNALHDQFPARVQTLTLMAAAALLDDDRTAVDDLEGRVLALRPTYAAFYHQLGELSVRNFRYVEAMDWFQRAIDLDGGFWRAYVSLGIGYSRIGDDERALQFLRRAFDNDPFNLQAYNMVELFEAGLQDYVVVQDAEIDGLSYRFYRTDQDILTRYVPPVIRGAWARYVAAYGIVPDPPVAIEIFHDQATFGVRSVGLPHASQHGICFGHLVTSRSPADGNFNWQMVLEHELSHVFSLTLSNYRVPRWLSEGMAEYDTAIAQAHWRREEELSMVRALQNDTLVSVDNLDRAFISVDNFEQIVAAYFQASLVVEFIAVQWEYEALLQMLRSYRDGADTQAAVEVATGLSVAEFDERFKQWLQHRLGDMLVLYEPSLQAPVDVAALNERIETESGDASLWAQLGLGLYQQGQPDLGAQALERALELNPDEPLANLVSGIRSLQAGDHEAAADHLRRIVDSGRRSFSAHFHLGEALLGMGQRAAALDEFRTAAALYPRDSTSRTALARELTATGDDDEALRWYREVAVLDENLAAAALFVAERAVEESSADEALVYARRALQIAPFEPQVHRTLGRACSLARVWSCAVEELELELRMGSLDRRQTLQLLLEAYEELGDTDNAARTRALLDG